jgi:hypothetical protein
MLFGRRGWDRQPTARAGVLLASPGTPFSRAAIARACELAAGEPVAVLSILKVYGSALGLPNPGLMPTRRERDEQYAIVKRAVASAERRGCVADGQITVTRSAGRTIAKVARRRNVRYVVMDEHEAGGLRRFTDGAVVATVRRGLADGARLELVTERALPPVGHQPPGERGTALLSDRVCRAARLPVSAGQAAQDAQRCGQPR